MTDLTTDEFSVGKEAAKFANEFIKENFDTIWKKSKSLFNLASKEFRVRLERTYEDYFIEVGEKYSKVKTFLINQEDVDLYKFYVPLGVSMRRTKFPDVSISDLTETNNFNIVTGSAGSGKSITMRHLFVDSIKEKKKVPVFIELRELNSPNLTLQELINRVLADSKFDLGEDFVEKALQLGYFIFFLDGFDELADDKRESIAKEVLNISKRYDQNQIIVSSRPDDFFNSWRGFRVWCIDDLSLQKACQLIDKLPFNQEVKDKFIKDLQEKLFEEHEYFLSNPLLLSIMWLCYSENASIPKKLSLFYQQAFEALFNKHDAKKGGFERKRKTSLDVKDFADAFSAFAVQTFDNNKIEFSESEAITFLNNSKQISNLEFNSNDLLKDCIKSVCLILEDGLKLRFSHRSFQEYFTAYFIVNSSSEIQKKLLHRYVDERITKDSVIQLVYSMKSEIVEQLLIIPEIDNLEKKIGYKGRITIQVFKKFFKEIFNSLFVGKNPTNGLDSIMLMVKNTKLMELSRLAKNMPEIDSKANNLVKLMTKNRSKLVSAHKRIFGRSMMRIEEKLNNKEFVELLMKSGYTLHLEVLTNAKPLLIEKHKEQRESLNDILGI